MKTQSDYDKEVIGRELTVYGGDKPSKEDMARLNHNLVTSIRDGNWIDKWGACKVCDGEIPDGHTNNCDIYKLECEVRRYKQLLNRVLEWCDTEDPNFEIDADVIRAALNPPTEKGKP